MANYQLYRSNVYLGGQMKYDIILGKEGNKLIVKDFHITPISSKSPNNKYAKDYLLNYKHHENIAKFYKKNSGSFYNDFVNPSLTNPWPLKKNDNNDKPESNSDSTYEMGCRRMQYYQLYNKQFEFFCPIWLENLKPNEHLRFKINVYNDEEMSYLIDSINIDLESRSKNDFHNKFCEYFYEYLKYIKCINENNINNWLFDINKNHSSVHGVDVTTGELKYLKCNSLFTNLTSRTRPVLETNNMILTELKNKLLIAKQLINFNLCFDVNDIFTNSIGLERNGSKVYINVKTYIYNNDGKETELDLVDFFTNHEHITVDDCNIPELDINNLDNPLTNNTDKSKNVLDYLGDFKYVDLITKNKIIQNTFHWCLTDNPTYHFNFYDGFAGTYNGEKLSVQNQTTPDISYPEYNKNINQYWCNIWKVKDAIGVFAKLFSNISSYKYLFSTWDGNCYVKNIFYEEKIDHPINIAFFIVDDFFNTKSRNDTFWGSLSKLDVKDYKTNILIETPKEPVEPEYDEEGNIMPQELEYGTDEEEIYTALRIDKKTENDENYYIFIIHTDTIKYNFPFKKFIEQIKDDDNNDDIKQILNGVKIKSDVLTIPGGITPDKCPSPSLSSEEIRYYKNNKLTILDRQLGKINPYFIKKNDPKYFNYRYFKYNIDKLVGDNKKGYEKYSNTNFLPLYPSLNYWCFGKNKEEYKNISNDFEWNCFDCNKIILLTPIISVTSTIKNNEKTIEELVKEYLKNKYPYHENLGEEGKIEKEWHDWVYNKYQYKSTFNSSEDDNYKYNVEIKLK